MIHFYTTILCCLSGFSYFSKQDLLQLVNIGRGWRDMLRQLLQSTLPSRISLRWNCPWHRNNFRPCFFPFKLQEKLNKDTVEARTKTRGGRLMLMRRVLREQPFLGYVTRPAKPTKLSFPL
ncbi:hypothetical protein RB195_006383 [Necator americanus]|uniref:Uncharacterized protein n=1 Tax=Necator americanus TaxID=51031 RepID=A0ABR1BVR5_NECAM